MQMVRASRASSVGSTFSGAPGASGVRAAGLSSDNSADQLRFIATVIVDARFANLVDKDCALALAKWAPSSLDTWIPQLRALSRTATMYQCTRAQVLSQPGFIYKSYFAMGRGSGWVGLHPGGWV